VPSCPCGSGLAAADCCYARYPSIVCPPGQPDPVDFYARWAINRNMLWQAVLPHVSRGGCPRESIVVLGAGSCRDLPMDFLCGAFREVVLVDKDAGALERADLFGGAAPNILKVVWNVNGRFGRLLPGLLGDSLADRKPQAIARQVEALLQPWCLEEVPAELRCRAPFSVVLSDLIMTQLAMYLALDVAASLGLTLRELYDQHRAEATAMASIVSRNHLGLLAALSAPGSGVLVLNDTFMVGRDFDGTESLFNSVVAGRGGDCAADAAGHADAPGVGDATWITATDIDSWMDAYSLLGSDLAGPLAAAGEALPLAPRRRTWWWWPHCLRKSYLVVCHDLLRV